MLAEGVLAEVECVGSVDSVIWCVVVMNGTIRCDVMVARWKQVL